jgi:hypothetical protein
MVRKIILPIIVIILQNGLCNSQAFVKTSDLFRRPNDEGGELRINQDPALDTLLSRYILTSKQKRTQEGSQGMEGFRIQIYYSSVRNAREESARERVEFINKFPDIISYAQYREPGYFMVRAGDYRTRTEGFKDLLRVRKVFPDAYFVPAIINFPDQGKK